MKQTCLFAGVSAHALLGGALLAMFLAAGLVNASQAGGPSSEAQSEGLSNHIPSSQAACEQPVGIVDQEPEKPIRGGAGRVILVLGTCNSVNVAPGDSSGCTSGSKCSVEDSGCGQGKTCKTLNREGFCFCSCEPQ